MVIIIDTTPVQGFEIALANAGIIQTRNGVDELFQESERLLPMIERMMKEQTLEMSDINEVWVAVGPGRFTAVRIGVAVANALAYALGIPVRSTERHSSEERIEDMIERFLVSPPVDRVEPVYGDSPLQ